jgi:fructokinase
LVLATAPRRLILGGGVMNAQPHLLSRIATLLPLSLNHYGLTGRIQSELSPYVVAPSLQKLAGPLGAIAVALAAQT